MAKPAERAQTPERQVADDPGKRPTARANDRDDKKFAESGKKEPAARDVDKVLETEEGKHLKAAELIGKRHEEDPALKR